MSASLQYRASNKRQPVHSVRQQQHNPINGGSFSTTNNRIDFRIPPEFATFLSCDDTRLKFDYTLTAGTQAAANLPYIKANSSTSLIQSIQVRVGSEVIEHITDYKRLHAVLQPLYVDTYQQVSSLNVEDPAKATAGLLQSTAGGLGQSGALAASSSAAVTTTPVAKSFSVSLPLILSSVGTAAKKAFPLAFIANDLHISIVLVDDIKKAFYAGNGATSSPLLATATVAVTNVVLDCKHITYPSEVVNKMMNSVGGELVYDGCQNITANSGAISYASAGKQYFILPNCQYSNIFNITQTHFVSPTLAGDDLAYQPSLFVSNSRVQIDGRYINNRGLTFGNSTAADQNTAELAMSAFYSNRRNADVDDINTSFRAKKTFANTSGWGCRNITGNPTASVTGSFQLGTASVLVARQFETCMCSHNLSNSQYLGRLRRGENTRGKEVVLEQDYSNTSTSVVSVFNSYIYSIGVKYIVNLKTGQMRVEM